VLGSALSSVLRSKALSDLLGLVSTQAPLLGLSKIVPPSTSILDVHSRLDFQSPGRLWLRLAVATGKSCSAFVVSHHFDGFLRRGGRGFVAPRCRSWDSSCFCFPFGSFDLSGFSFHDASPFEAFPSTAAILTLVWIPTLVSFTFQGKCDFRVFFRCASPLFSLRVAALGDSRLPWVFPCLMVFVSIPSRVRANVDFRKVKANFCSEGGALRKRRSVHSGV
jgi:hypothetical protein